MAARRPKGPSEAELERRARVDQAIAKLPPKARAVFDRIVVARERQALLEQSMARWASDEGLVASVPAGSGKDLKRLARAMKRSGFVPLKAGTREAELFEAYAGVGAARVRKQKGA